MEKTYIAIDLKSFYASVECNERGLNPLTTHLVVADSSRTDKTICLAVSPSLKAYGIPGRPRLFEVIRQVKQINAEKQRKLHRHLSKASTDQKDMDAHPDKALGYITAMPRMALYLQYSAQIYNVYLKYIAPEDIHVYSIDEVFIDATAYLGTYHMTGHELAMTMIRDVLSTTGITATAGIGPNMYLAKVAMDIVAKHIDADADGVRIAELDEISYRQKLWTHTPLTDFWRVGPGIARRLNALGLYTMGDVARCSLGENDEHYNEDLLYEAFGVNAELLIDHAWGWEPATIADIKTYKPSSNQMGSGQVLMKPYPYDKAKIITREMIDTLVLDLVQRHMVASSITLSLSYDAGNIDKGYNGPMVTDFYGRKIPKHAHGTARFEKHTDSAAIIVKYTMALFERITNPMLSIRKVSMSLGDIRDKDSLPSRPQPVQMDLFTDYEAKEKQEAAEKERLAKEEKMQKTLLDIKRKFGKNAAFKGTSLEEDATGLERNNQIGGHKA